MMTSSLAGHSGIARTVLLCPCAVAESPAGGRKDEKRCWPVCGRELGLAERIVRSERSGVSPVTCFVAGELCGEQTAARYTDIQG